MFVYKHTEILEYVTWPTFLQKYKLHRLDNSRILTIKISKISGYSFYMN